MKNLSLLLLVLFSLVGCVTVNVVTNESYKNKDMTNSTITILPIPEDGMVVLNTDDVVDDFKKDFREPYKVVQDSLYNILEKYTQLNIRNIKYQKSGLLFDRINALKDTTRCFKVTKKIGKKGTEYGFWIPKKTFIDELGISTDVVVILNRVSFSRSSQQSAGHWNPGYSVSTPGGTMNVGGGFAPGGNTEYLSSTVKFIIWDYRENDAITYGETSANDSIFLAMTATTWRSNFKHITRQIFANSPFSFLLTQ